MKGKEKSETVDHRIPLTADNSGHTYQSNTLWN